MSGRFGFRSGEGMLSREITVVLALKMALLLLLWLMFFSDAFVLTSDGVTAALLKSGDTVQAGGKP